MNVYLYAIMALVWGTSVAAELTSSSASGQANSGPYMAMGVRVGEVSANSAVLWTRLTKNEQPNRDGFDLREASWRTKVEVPADLTTLWGSCPGSPGRVRLRYWSDRQPKDETTTHWHEVEEETDYTLQFTLRDFSPNTQYRYVIEASKSGGSEVHSQRAGRFTTAPAADDARRVQFTVVTGQGHRDLTDDAGYQIYPSMAAMQPDFMVSTGDAVYLDSEWPRATSTQLASYHWQRAGSLARNIDFWQQTPGYWMKDDHDTYADDCWPTLRVKQSEPFTFAEGVQMFCNHTPSSDIPYRTFRWGRDLQIWLVEAREYRMPNDAPDDEDKTLWGAEQLAWLKRTVQESDATWKLLISPTPIVGPERKGKFDNHSSAFRTEGSEFLRWLSSHQPERMFVLCGDIHFQYHSVDTNTEVHEFSCGPASNEHSGGSTGKKPQHRFHRVGGGFLSATVDATDEESLIHIVFHDVDGTEVYRFSRSRALSESD